MIGLTPGQSSTCYGQARFASRLVRKPQRRADPLGRPLLRTLRVFVHRVTHFDMGCFGAGCHRGLSATSGRGRFGARHLARSVSARGVSGVPDLVVYLHDGHLVVNAGDLVRLCARQGCPGSQQRLAHHSNDFRVYRRCRAGDGGRVAVSRHGCIVVSHFRLGKARHPFGHPRGRIRRCRRRFFSRVQTIPSAMPTSSG